MFTRRFWGWVGVGVLGTLAIPTLAAPHVAKLIQRRPPVQTQRVSKLPVKKPTTKATTQPVQTADQQRRPADGPASVKAVVKRQPSARAKKKSR